MLEFYSDSDCVHCIKLRDTLASIYLEKPSAQRLVTDANIRPELVSFSDRAIDNWTNIIQEAEEQGRLIRLVQLASEENQANETLKDVLEILKAGRKCFGCFPYHARFLLTEPRVPKYFKNRSREIRRLVSLVRKKEWCGLFGIGGMGKTMLAASVARKIRKEDSVSVIWLSCNDAPSVDLILETFARSVGQSLRSIADANQRGGFLRNVTHEKGLLVVFDDVNEDAILKQLLHAVGHGNSVLVTGRNHGLSSIQEFCLFEMDLEPLPIEAASHVLVELSGVRSSAAGSINSWKAIAESVGNLPLALEIIAGDMRFRSSSDPSIYLDGQVKTGLWLQKGEAHERLYSALENSVKQLPVNYSKAFWCLGIFAGSGFGVSAVKAVCSFVSDADTEDFLVAMRKLMLVKDRSDGLLSLHPTIKEFARKQLMESGIDTKAVASPVGEYVAFYLLQLQQFGGYEWNMTQYCKLVPVEWEIMNAIDTAYGLWIDQNCAEKETFGRIAIEMTSRISWYLCWRGYWNLRIKLCSRITEQVKALSYRGYKVGSFSNAVGNLYVDQGWIHLWRKEYDKTRYCIDQAKPLIGFTDRQFATELDAQLALETGGADKAYRLFNELVRQGQINTRSWFVYSYRCADSLVALGKHGEAIGLLDELLGRIPNAVLVQNELIGDVHASIAYRLAKLLKPTEELTSEALFEHSIELFRDCGIVNQTVVEAEIELAGILSASDAGRSNTLLDTALEKAKILGHTDLVERIGRIHS